MATHRKLGDLAYRWWYYLSMYTGIRAWRNRRRALRGDLDPRILGLHAARIEDAQLGELLLWVHPRVRRGQDGERGNHGMISLQRTTPEVGRLTYWYLCCTSHYGRGHAEVAFYERAGEVTVYGVRNIARANARRLGLARLSDRLRLAVTEEEGRILQLVSAALLRAGLPARLAPARECIDLSVDDRLLPPDRRARVRETLLRRYARMILPSDELAA